MNLSAFVQDWINTHPECHAQYSGQQVAFIDPVGPVLSRTEDYDLASFYEEIKVYCQDHKLNAGTLVIHNFSKVSSVPHSSQE